MQNCAYFTKFRQSEYIVGTLSLQASSCKLFYHRMSIFRRKVQIFVGGQNELTMVTLMQNSAKINKFRQSEYIVGIISLQASRCIHFYRKMSIFCRKVQIFVGGQNELTLVTLMQNSAKITKFRQCEHIYGISSLQASSCIYFHHKMSIFRRKVQNCLGGQNDLTLVTLTQNCAKIDKFCQREHIFGHFSLQPSGCIHSHPKTLHFWRKVQVFVGGQNELTLVTLMQNSAKFTKFHQSENIVGILSLQASSCIHFYHKMSIFRRKVQIFEGGQFELTMVTLLQTSAKINKFRQSEYIVGIISLQASCCIHFYRKMSIFCRKVQIFVGGQNELTLVTLMQNSAKFTKFCQSEYIVGILSLQASSCNLFYHKMSIFCRKVQIIVGGQNELTMVTLMQNSAKINKFRQSEYIVGIISLQASRCIHFYRKMSIFCRKVQIFVGGQNELTLVTLMQNSAKITKFRQCEHIYGISSLQASSCIYFYHKRSIFRRKVQNFLGGQNELTLVTLRQNCAKTDKFCQREHIFGNFSLQASDCIHSQSKTLHFCRKLQVFVGGQNELTLVTLTQNCAKTDKICQREHIFGNFSLQASDCIHSQSKHSIFAENCKFL